MFIFLWVARQSWLHVTMRSLIAITLKCCSGQWLWSSELSNGTPMASVIFEDPTAMNDIVMADSLCRAASTSYFSDVINQNLIDRMFPIHGTLRTWLR